MDAHNQVASMTPNALAPFMSLSPNMPPQFDLHSLLASMPEAMSVHPMPTTNTGRPMGSSMPNLSNLFLSPDQLTALSMSLLSIPPLFASTTGGPGSLPHPFFPSLPLGMPSLTPHSTIESLGLINASSDSLLRTSVSALPSPVQSQGDLRPRAFSSAARLQHPSKNATPEKRRKRSRNDESVLRPKAVVASSSSILRNLVEADEEPIQMQLSPPTRHDDERIKADVARVIVLSSTACEPPAAKRSPPPSGAPAVDSIAHLPLRRIIRDQDLPDVVGPDSPFRHHPKYQKQRRTDPHTDMVEKMEALTAFCVVSGMWTGGEEKMESGDSSTAEATPAVSPKTSSDSGYTSADSPSKKSFSDILDQAIVRELITAE